MKINKMIKIVGACASAIGILVLISSCGQKEKLLAIYTESGDVVAEVPQEYNFEDPDMAYCDIAIDEAVQILSEQLDISESKARKALWKKGYKVYTYYEKSAQTSLKAACGQYCDRFNCSGAMTDLEGDLVAVYGYSPKDKESNYARNQAAPYSSIKPLSVYMQAVEKGLINWSTTYHDSAYKEMSSSGGNARAWPQNANGTYAEKNVTVFHALQKSLNTVAVKCLKDVGVNESIEFLYENFAMPLSSEQYSSTIHGEEEVIGNIAMGYLQEGVSPVDMAGYYQIFGNGGKYEKPLTVAKICDKKDKVLYERTHESKEVISLLTVDLMNKMLQGVTQSGGTGSEAYCEGVEVAGKTGTADNNADCWFVGLSPEYSCAIWHGQNYKNLAPYIFSLTMNAVYQNNQALKHEFDIYSELEPIIYCEESGMKVSPNCTLIQQGYYVSGTEMQTCDKH